MEITTAGLLIAIAVVVIALIVTLLALIKYSGLLYFPEVTTGKPSLGRCKIAYKFMKGSYNGVFVGATFTEVTSITPTSKNIGIYYDDPNVVSDEECRCAIGCIVEDSESPTLDKQIEELLIEKEFKFFTLPPVDNAVLSQFPYTTPFSIRLSSLKVYPLLKNFIADKGLCAYPMIEFYHDCLIDFIVPLSKQQEFFVPEAEPSLQGHSNDSSCVEDVSASQGESSVARDFTSGNSIVSDDVSSPDTAVTRDILEGDDNSDLDESDTSSSFEQVDSDEAKRKDSSA